MRKKLFITAVIFSLIILIFIAVYKVNLSKVDTKYAADFSKVFASYDIDAIDNYLSENTEIISCGKAENYKTLLDNVIIACKEKRYLFPQGSSYGYGNDKFANGIQNINIFLFGKFDEADIGEVNIKMQLKKVGLFKYEIFSLECDDAIFEYLFYGT